ncbi:hypothetical protein F2Q69_00046741 [Brassica cretica]|uniref:DUF7903 domain-containing protein n=1 Tax=Brassica cretica TaxID=69181 RepID=A0A8S9PTW9_BRACR|nr:hypothetical protein F2Q69_00046741 [Brassica cretica]
MKGLERVKSRGRILTRVVFWKCPEMFLEPYGISCIVKSILYDKQQCRHCGCALGANAEAESSFAPAIVDLSRGFAARGERSAAAPSSSMRSSSSGSKSTVSGSRFAITSAAAAVVYQISSRIFCSPPNSLLDPNVKSSLRWPFGKSSSGDLYRVFESCHVKAPVYKNQTLRLRVRETDIFSERIGTGEVKREVILMLKDMNSKLQVHLLCSFVSLKLYWKRSL